MEALTRFQFTRHNLSHFLTNRLRGIFEGHKLSCFLSDLKDEIRLPIHMLNPLNISAASGLAKIEEEYLASSRKVVKSVGEKSTYSVGGSHSGLLRAVANEHKFQLLLS